MLFHELWVWASEHNRIFLRIFCPRRQNIWNFFWHVWQNICWYERIFFHMFMDEQYLWMKMWMKTKRINFLLKVANRHVFCKKMNNRNKVKILYVGLFWIIQHWNVQVIFHISLIWNILSSVASKPISTPRRYGGY